LTCMVEVPGHDAALEAASANTKELSIQAG
jgi:hypothetical protein